MKEYFRHCPFCKTDLVEKNEKEITRLYCNSCNKFIYDNPGVGVGVFVISDGQLLLVKRNIEPRKGFWALPGGFVEQGESVEQAALRELVEETGLKGREPEIVKVFTEQTSTYGTVVVPIVKAEVDSMDAKAGDDAIDAAFFKPEDIPEIAFKSHHEFIREWLKNGKYKL